MPIRVVMLLFCWMISFLPVLAEELPVKLEASFPYSLNPDLPVPGAGSFYSFPWITSTGLPNRFP